MRIVLTFFIFSMLVGCSVQMPQPRWSARDALEVKSFPSKNITVKGDISSAISNSIQYLSKSPAELLSFGEKQYAKSTLLKSYELLATFLKSNPSRSALNDYLIEHFEFFQSAADKVLITGYYVPEVEGSLIKDNEYKYPLYATPKDLVQISLSDEIKSKLTADVPVINRGRLDKAQVLIPYYSRLEIDSKNILANKNLELVYLKDPLDRFFAHIQGSVHIKLPDGKSILAAYDNKNGHPYRAIGKRLIELGMLAKENTTMESIKSVLRSHVDIQEEILNWNPSYVFFKLTKDRAKGSLGTEVIGQVSIATDQSLFPKGALGLLNLNGEWILTANHDTGGAITGPGRIDYFLGQGTAAGQKASGLQSYGMVGFLAPKY